MIQNALKLARAGFYVFPLHTIKNNNCTCNAKGNCNSAGKHPVYKNWQSTATKDPEAIRQLWQSNPSYNIGIKTGDGLIVVDVDLKNNGLENYNALIEENGETKTFIVTTGSGGKHLFYTDPSKKITNRTGVVGGIDIRGNGGYVVAVTSLHKSGNKYKLLDFGTNTKKIRIAEAPEWLVDILNEKNKMVIKNSGHIKEGSRNTYLTQQAGTLRSKGLAYEEILIDLEMINNESCSPPLSESEVKTIAKSVSRYAVMPAKKDWGSLVLDIKDDTGQFYDIPDNLLEQLPNYLGFVNEKRLSSGLPKVAILVPLATTISAILGNAYRISPYKGSDHVQGLNLFGLVVAPSGSRKTSALNYAKKFADILDGRLSFIRDEENQLIRNKIGLLKNELHSLKKDSERNQEFNQKFLELEKLNNSIKNWCFTTGDSTPESLIQLFKDNHRGIFFVKDELDSLLQQLNKQSYEVLRSLINQAWNSGESLKVSRIGRGIIEVSSATLSMLGTIQPDIIYQHFFHEIKNGSSGDGLLARFQLLAVYGHKDVSENTKNNIYTKYENKIQHLVDLLDDLTFEINKDNQLPNDSLFLSDKAKRIFDDFDRQNRVRLISAENKSHAYQSHISKYNSFILRLAGQFHIVHHLEKGSKIPLEVQAVWIDLAIKWAAYFDGHAQRMYLGIRERHLKNSLLSRIKDGSIKDKMTIRSIYRNNWSGLNSKEDVIEAIEKIAPYNWAHISFGIPQAGGRYTEIIQLNPELIEWLEVNHKGQADKTDDSWGVPK